MLEKFPWLLTDKEKEAHAPRRYSRGSSRLESRVSRHDAKELEAPCEVLHVRDGARLELAVDHMPVVVHLEGTGGHELRGHEAQHLDVANKLGDERVLLGGRVVHSMALHVGEL